MCHKRAGLRRYALASKFKILTYIYIHTQPDLPCYLQSTRVKVSDLNGFELSPLGSFGPHAGARCFIRCMCVRRDVVESTFQNKRVYMNARASLRRTPQQQDDFCHI